MSAPGCDHVPANGSSGHDEFYRCWTSGCVVSASAMASTSACRSRRTDSRGGVGGLQPPKAPSESPRTGGDGLQIFGQPPVVRGSGSHGGEGGPLFPDDPLELLLKLEGHASQRHAPPENPAKPTHHEGGGYGS